MKMPTEYCKLILDQDERITQWICAGLNEDLSWVGEHKTLGMVYKGNLIGGLIYHNLRDKHDLWWTIYTIDKRWCNRRILAAIFGYAFNFLRVKKINILVNTNNAKCLKLVTKLGFRQEGLLRCYREDGSDCYIYGMLKSENKWKGKKHE